MGQKISTLFNSVCNRSALRRLRNATSTCDNIEEHSSNLQPYHKRRIRYFDIWMPSNHEKDVVLVWLDEQIDIDVENVTKMKALFQKVNDQTLLFSNENHFIEFVETLTNERVFLIISGQVSVHILSFVHTKEHIHAIYIFCMDEDHFKGLIGKYSKLRGVYNHNVRLILDVQKDISIYQKQSMKFHSLSKDEQESLITLTLDSTLFLWSYLLKEILINTDTTNDAKEIMLAYCHSQYESNDSILAEINEFDKYYQSSNAIEWYTKDSFVYRLVNKFIRTENIDALLNLKFFIVDLSTCLKSKWEQDYNQQTREPFKVYRGAYLTNTETEKLKPDTLISPNGYFSTSESLETASIYAVNTIFEIDIDPSVRNIIFASIAEYSQFPEEQEILFDLGCTFKIVHVYHDDSIKRLIVKMVGVNEGEKFAGDFMKTLKVRKKNNRHFDGLMNDFVHKLGYERGMRLYEHFLRLSTTDVQRILNNCFRFISLYKKYCDASNVIILYGCFGWFFTQRGEYDLAIEYCNRALSIVEKNSSNENTTIEIAMIHNTIGWSYYEKENYDRALFWCQKAAEIFKHCSYTEDSKYVRVLRSEQKLQKSPSRNHVEYAEILTNIGCIYFKKNYFDEAISYCKISTNTLERCDHEIIFERDNNSVVASSYEIDNHHETIAANHEVFADIYYSKENYFLALEYYQKAQDIFLKITPKIPICLQRSPSIFGRNLRRLQNSIRITEKNLIASKKRTSEATKQITTTA
ncbi:unnamed protein product [Rotaria magnacalcarata]